MGRGGYLVFFQCPPQVAMARFVIEGGVYIYVGSCGASCLRRVLRHLERPKARRWHVDFLQCRALYGVLTRRGEREVARCLAEMCQAVEGFGSTDNPEAPGHLFKCGLVEALRCVKF
ncbi:MAG: DUF123 domain-containing protein [Pyrobaculum sp.]